MKALHFDCESYLHKPLFHFPILNEEDKNASEQDGDDDGHGDVRFTDAGHPAVIIKLGMLGI